MRGVDQPGLVSAWPRRYGQPVSSSPTPLLRPTLDEWTALLSSRTRAVALLTELYAARDVWAEVPAAVSGVSQRVWKPLVATLEHALPTIEATEASDEGTVKYRLRFKDAAVETVRIPAPGRSTICVSSQAGCTRACAFCATATLGFSRNLRAEEIVAQYLVARREAPADAPARNVVFMGMGEPMDNLDEVLRAVTLLTQSPAPNLSASRVTVSTSGVLPGMKRFLAESTASLALSLNATTDEVRARLMPHTRTWPIDAMLKLLRADRRSNPRRVHFIEYVLFEGVNASDEDAARLGALMQGINARVNLIPYNPRPGSPFRPPSPERVLAFQRQVVERGLLCLVRWPRGQHVAAACGQLMLAQNARGFLAGNSVA